LAVIGSNKPATASLDEEKLQTILNRILVMSPQGTLAPTGGTVVPQGTTPSGTALAANQANNTETAETVDEVEELAEEVEEVEELEELTDEAGAAETETGKEAAAVEEVETVEELEELTEEPDQNSEEITEAKTSPHGGSLLATATALAEGTKHTNVEVAFGDDDIPYVVETSGLELMDGDVDAALASMKEDEPEALEELDEVEDLEVLEELGPSDSGSGPAEESHTVQLEIEHDDDDSSSRGSSESDIAELASKIEFSSPDPIAEESDDNFDEELEIVSPFASMLSGFDDSDNDSPEELSEEESDAPKEENADLSPEDEKKND
jgi:hypothetical protein